MTQEEFWPLADGVVPGLLQSAYRGELCAVVSALHFCAIVQTPVCIWSDCMGVVRRVRRLLEGSWMPTLRTKHFDLWSRILPLVESLRPWVTVCKVSSHLDPTLESTAGDEWCAAHNNHVDGAANRAQLQRPDSFLATWQAACLAWDEEFRIVKEVLALHLRVGQKATRTKPARVPSVAMEPPLPEHPCYLGDGSPEQLLVFRRKYGHSYAADLGRFTGALQILMRPFGGYLQCSCFLRFVSYISHLWCTGMALGLICVRYRMDAMCKLAMPSGSDILLVISGSTLTRQGAFGSYVKAVPLLQRFK